MARNADRQIAALERHKRFLDFTEDGLGDDLLKIATDGCLECVIGQHDPDGNPWPDPSPEYAKWKARKYPGHPPGVLHFVMARPEEVAGEPEITPDRAKVTYGKTQGAKDEIAWFAKGGRRFWGFTARSRAAAKDFLDRRLRSLTR